MPILPSLGTCTRRGKEGDKKQKDRGRGEVGKRERGREGLMRKQRTTELRGKGMKSGRKQGHRETFV